MVQTDGGLSVLREISHTGETNHKVFGNYLTHIRHAFAMCRILRRILYSHVLSGSAKMTVNVKIKYFNCSVSTQTNDLTQ